MKRFFFSILFVSVFCIGLGALADKAGANFKSDEKALALIQKARLAIGGDAAIAGVQSLSIVGKTSRTFKIDGSERSEQGETEIAMQLPDKLMKMIKLGNDDAGGDGTKMIDRQVNIVTAGGEKGKIDVTVDTEDGGTGAVKKIVVKKDDGTVQEFTGAEADKIVAADGANGGKAVKKIIIKRPDGTTQELTGAEADKMIAQNRDGSTFLTTSDGKTGKVSRENVIVNRAGSGDHDSMKHNEMLRLTLSLLLTSPQGMDVSYTFGGESSVDGTACNLVNAEFAGATFKLYLGQTSNLPVMMTYTGMRMPMLIKFKTEGSKSGEPKDNVDFMRKVDGPPMETAEFSVKFSDYHSVNGIQLPFKWTQTVGGAADETFDVTSYDINPANIADKFKNQRVIVRTARPVVQ